MEITKSHILSEIRRTAHANGGVPLGRTRFEAEAGIKESDWLGKFWARWSDAIHEAGFEPNKRSAPHDQAILLQKHADLSRELGRLPTRAELRLKRRDDKLFPSEGLYWRHFGKRQHLKKNSALQESPWVDPDVPAFFAPSPPRHWGEGAEGAKNAR